MADPVLKALEFHSDAVADSTLMPFKVTGEEKISSLYRFVIDLVSPKNDIDLAAILRQPAYLAIKQGVRLKGSDQRGVRRLKFQGVLAFFEQTEQHLEGVHYRAVLVPRLWQLSLSVQSRIFMEKTVPEIVEEVLKEAGFTTQDYEFKTKARQYAAREFVVQYQESDLDFISRWLEHEGIFYFFEHTDEGDKVIFADSTSANPTIHGETIISYKPTSASDSRAEVPESESADEWFRTEVVQSLACRQTVIPKQVILKDYNWRKPSQDLKCEADVLADGVGKVYQYASHYKDTAEGKILAQVRSEEIKCRQKIFSGKSDCRSFRAGARMTLTDHYRADFNADHLLVEVRHRMSQAVPRPPGSSSVPTYENDFVSIPADQVFRPQRITPWPAVRGVLNGLIDGGGSAQYAEIDDQGRYKVKLPFDLSDRKDGTASRYVRMAQPYSGAGFGMHFPLHKGTEVLLTFVDGNPDRPIIAASVPNAETASPVAGANQTQCKIQTGGGTELLVEDADGSQFVTLRNPSENSYLSMGADHHSEHHPPGVSIGSKAGISVSAGQGIALSAGSPNHDNAVSIASAAASEVGSTAAKVAAIAALACGIAADASAGGVGAILGIAGDLAGAIGGHVLPSAYVTAPGKAAIIGKSEAILGSLGSADVIAGGPANILSASSALVAGGLAAAIVSAGNVEAVANFGDVRLHAKYRGNVVVEAKKGVRVEAETTDVVIDAKKQNIRMGAHKDLTLMARTGWGRVSTNKELWIESVEAKKIQLKAGKSIITLEDEKITIQADSVVLQSNDQKATLVLGKEGKEHPFKAQSKGMMAHISEDNHAISSKKGLLLDADQEVVMITERYDSSGVKNIERKHSKEG